MTSVLRNVQRLDLSRKVKSRDTRLSSGHPSSRMQVAEGADRKSVV